MYDGYENLPLGPKVDNFCFSKYLSKQLTIIMQVTGCVNYYRQCVPETKRAKRILVRVL